MKTKHQTKTNKTSAASRSMIGKFDEAVLLESVTGFVKAIKTRKARGLRVTDVTLPARLPTRTAAEVRQVRESLGVSQSVFASYLNVPARTVVSWENDQRKPSGAALRLLDIAARHPEVILTQN